MRKVHIISAVAGTLLFAGGFMLADTMMPADAGEPTVLQKDSLGKDCTFAQVAGTEVLTCDGASEHALEDIEHAFDKGAVEE